MRDAVIACYFTSHLDPQRGYRWPADPNELAPLLSTVSQHQLVVLHDCFDPDALLCEHHMVDTPRPASQQRWIAEYDYLTTHPDIRFAWCVDSTDVRMLNDPFPHMRLGTLYTGCVTCETVDWGWIQGHMPTTSDWIRENGQRMLLNAGTVGGDRDTMLWFLKEMVNRWATKDVKDLAEDMAYFNMIAYEHPRLIFGPQVTTEFRKWATEDPRAWFAHK